MGTRDRLIDDITRRTYQQIKGWGLERIAIEATTLKARRPPETMADVPASTRMAARKYIESVDRMEHSRVPRSDAGAWAEMDMDREWLHNRFRAELRELGLPWRRGADTEQTARDIVRRRWRRRVTFGGIKVVAVQKPHLFDVYVTRASIDRGAGSGAYREVIWRKRVKATSRHGALGRCLPEIRRRVLSRITDPTIKYVSVYVGRKGSVTGSASRLHPIQVVVSTGQIR